MMLCHICRQSRVSRIDPFRPRWSGGRSHAKEHDSYALEWHGARVGRVNGVPFDERIELYRNGDIGVTTWCGDNAPVGFFYNMFKETSPNSE
jgi:hypothetical protein